MRLPIHASWIPFFSPPVWRVCLGLLLLLGLGILGCWFAPPGLVRVLPRQAELIWRFRPKASLADFPGRELWAQLPAGAREHWLVQAPLGPRTRGWLLVWRGPAWAGPQARMGAVALPSTRLRGRQLQHWRDRRGQTWSYATWRGIRLLGTVPWMVEEALRQAPRPARSDWQRHLAQLPPQGTGVLQLAGLQGPWRWQWLQPTAGRHWMAIGEGGAGSALATAHQEPAWTTLAPNLPLDLLALEPLLTRSPVNPSATRQWQAAFAPWLGGTPLLGTRNVGGSIARVLVLPWRSAAAAQRSLAQLAAQSGRLERYTYQSFAVERLLNTDFAAVFPGYGLEKWQNVYLTRGAGAVWLSASRHALERWIDAFVVGATYGNLPPRGWTAGPALRCYFGAHQATLAPSSAALAPWGLAAVSWRGEGRLRGQRWEARLDPVGAAASPTAIALLWQLSLPGGVPPRQAWPMPAWGGVLVQDAQQRLHLIDTSGYLRWSRALEGPWLGAPVAVDYYADGTRQALANTASAVHCLDPSGQDIPGFPLVLQNPAATALVAAGERGDFFLAARNGALYGYDRQGRPLAGWNPGPNVGPVDQPLYFGQQGGRDYLFVLNRAATLSVWDRSAQRHFADQRLDQAVAGLPALQWLPQVPRWVVGQSKGTLRVINPAGEGFNLGLDLDPGPTPARVLLADLQGDARLDAAAVRGRQLVVAGYRGNQWRTSYRLTLPQTPDSLFAWHRGDRTYLGLRYGASGPLELVDAQGRRLPGAPLPGVTLASLPGGRLAVVLHDNQVVGYRLP